jgi:hypothetical protein
LSPLIAARCSCLFFSRFFTSVLALCCTKHRAWHLLLICFRSWSLELGKCLRYVVWGISVSSRNIILVEWN